MKMKISILLNILIIVFGLMGVVIAAKYHLLKDFFLYYTNLSNIFAVLASIIYLLTLNKKTKIGEYLRFLSTICLTLTLLVVIFILTPMLKVNLFVGNYMPLYHLICPLLSIISLLFFEKNNTKPILALIPTAIYGIITLSLNYFKVIEGPYPFLKVHNQAILTSIIWIIVIYGINYLAALIISKANKKIRTK